MKAFKLYFLGLVVLLLTGSCSESILDRDEKDVLPATQVLNSLEGVEAILFQVYQDGRSIHQNPDISLYKQCGTDVARSGTNMVDVPEEGMRGMMTYSSGLAATSDLITQIWDRYYAAIAKCNLVIQASDNYEAADETEAAAVLRFKGEALVMRAVMYLELVRRFENIPIAEPLPDGDPPRTEAPLANKADVYNLIIADAMEAIDLLPTRSENGTVGLPSQGLANMILAEAYLDLGKNEDAAAAAEAVINDDSYALQPLDIVFSLEGGKTGNENNNELIFSWVFDPAVVDQSQYTSVMYTPLYDRLPGVARTMEQGGRPWARFTPTDYYWSTFDPADGRLEAWHKLVWYIDDLGEDGIPAGFDPMLGDPVTPEYLEAWCSNDNECRYVEPTTTKHWEDGTYGRTVAEGEGYKNIILYRYSQAFLLAAEAYIQSGQTMLAAEKLNVLRERAFGNADHNFTSADLQTLVDEHARELGHEGHRWAFLKRLNMLKDRATQYNPDATNMQDYQLRWPIPQTFIDLAGVEQNTGY
ncbi:MAG: RagB/SusD family nutrient uptake outer membrane protein [Phaeodactylibacter sp.]|nr:RagB/SusD family nutrient uptake outer membrane protein [Phaeodactylibacter sp.]